MYTTAIYDELSQIEREVVEGERRLAEQEALIIEMKRQNEDTAKAEGELERMRMEQRRRDQDRQRLLSRLQPLNNSAKRLIRGSVTFLRRETRQMRSPIRSVAGSLSPKSEPASHCPVAITVQISKS